MSGFRFYIQGVPQTQGNLRRNRTGQVYEANRNLAEWKRHVAAEVARQYEGGELMTGAVRLALHFYLPRPGGHYGTGRNEGKLRPSAPDWPTKKPDLDKLERAILDSLTGIVWRDDAQVAEKWAVKSFVDQSPARVMIAVEPARLPPTRTQ